MFKVYTASVDKSGGKTWTEAKTYVRDTLGMRIHRKSLGSYSHEYRVSFPGDTEESAYYTEDMLDAIRTAEAMCTCRNLATGRG